MIKKFAFRVILLFAILPGCASHGWFNHSHCGWILGEQREGASLKKYREALQNDKVPQFCHQYREKGYCRLNLTMPTLSPEGMEYLKENLKKRMAELLKDKKLFKEIEWVELPPATKGFFLDISLDIENVDRERGREKWYDKPLAFLLYIPLGGWLSGFYHDEFYSATLNKLEITLKDLRNPNFKLPKIKEPAKLLSLTSPVNFHERTRGFYQYLLFFVPVLPPIWGPWDREEVILNLSYKLFVDFLNRQFLPILEKIGFNHGVNPVIKDPFLFRLAGGEIEIIYQNDDIVEKIWVNKPLQHDFKNASFLPKVPFLKGIILTWDKAGVTAILDYKKQANGSTLDKIIHPASGKQIQVVQDSQDTITFPLKYSHSKIELHYTNGKSEPLKIEPPALKIPYQDSIPLEYTLIKDGKKRSILVDLRPLKFDGASSQGCQAYIKKDKPGKGNNP